MLEEIRKYYDNLYTTKGYVRTEFADSLNIPQLPEHIKLELDEDVTLQEVGNAVLNLQKGKVVGTDGLPIEWYKMFWPKIKELFFEVIKEIIADKKMHLSARRGILSLMDKPGKEILKLQNWRPLTLLNSDNKIYTKIMVLRLQKALPLIIHDTQQGFMKGRHLAKNLLKLQEVIDHCNKTNQNGVIISFDFYKAFDTVEIPSLMYAFRKFNFGEHYLDIIAPIFKDAETYVMNNGYWSAPIHPSRGCRQGCCYSPLAFNVIVELLGIALRQNDNIEGFQILETLIKSGQFADDLWTATKADSKCVNEVLVVLERFRNFAGLKINTDKCAILRIGPWKDSDVKFYTLKKLYWSPGSIRILGVNLHSDPQITFEDNFTELLNKTDDILNRWENRCLLPMEKITVVNSLINTMYIHKFMALPTPPQAFFEAHKRKILKFIWGNRPHKVSYTKVIQKYERLGLKLVDLQLKDAAIKAAWPLRLHGRQYNEISWFYNSLPIKDERIWSTNTKSTDIKPYLNEKSLQPVVSIWMAWSKFNYREVYEDPQEMLDATLWGNSHIHLRNKPIFDKIWLDTNINRVLDIYNIERKAFHKYEDIENVYGNHITFINYCALVAAIPRFWKSCMKTLDYNNPIDLTYNYDKLAEIKTPSKVIYWELVECYYQPTSAAKTL